MSVKIVAQLECDNCGVRRGSEPTLNMSQSVADLRRVAQGMSGWRVYGSEQQYDECGRCIMLATPHANAQADPYARDAGHPIP